MQHSEERKAGRGKKRMEERQVDDRLIYAACDGGGSGGWGRRMVG